MAVISNKQLTKNVAAKLVEQLKPLTKDEDILCIFGRETVFWLPAARFLPFLELLAVASSSKSPEEAIKSFPLLAKLLENEDAAATEFTELSNRLTGWLKQVEVNSTK